MYEDYLQHGKNVKDFIHVFQTFHFEMTDFYQ